MTARTITVRRRLKAPAADVYATLTDPDRFARVRGIRSVEVITEGPDGPASAGTVRRVNLPVGFLVEEIVAVEPPTRFDYLIRDAAMPLDHRFGRIELHDDGDHTEAIWTSTIAFDQPGVGPALTLIAAVGSHLGFAAALREMDRAALSNLPTDTSKDR
jgi:uncharacterized protein YndB with AHSA1/START domain